MEHKKFDLNIEQVLENWEVEHAIREIIANALDETNLSGCRDIEIAKSSSGKWEIRDFGRGLQIEHFTMNENVEKLAGKPGVIGKFGVGLKDALATLHRHKISFYAESKHGRFRVEEADKVGFNGIRTLHVSLEAAPDSSEGTRFVFDNLPDDAITKAKSLFLRFSEIQTLEKVPFGEILLRSGNFSAVYIHGVKVNEEANFLFSYNITSLTDAMRKRLNRERTNVGRTLYSDRIKAMLRDAQSEEVLSRLIEQVEARAQGETSDEIKWIEVAQKALTELSKRKRIVYFTEEEAMAQHNILDQAHRDEYVVQIVTEQEKTKMINAEDRDERTIFIADYQQSFNKSFSYTFVSEGDLRQAERDVFLQASKILAVAGVKQGECPRILISETMRLDADATVGVWDTALGAIIIGRSQLCSIEAFAGTLLHEIIHATTGLPDVSRDFESILTDYLGRVAASALAQQSSKKTGLFSRLSGDS
jgi:hypothetical protein